MAVSVSDVLARVAEVLKLAGPSALAAYWTEIASDALADGLADVYGSLAARGYTPDAVTAWPDLDTFTLRQAVFWALTRGGSLEAYDTKLLEKLDCREQLKTVGLTDASRNVQGAAGSVGRGSIKPPADERGQVLSREGHFRRW